MKTIGLEHATLAACIKDARHERIVITRKGKPVALVVGVEGLDEEQLRLASSEQFWTLIETRRKQKTISRAELERRITDIKGNVKTTVAKRKMRRIAPPLHKLAAADRSHVAVR